MNLERSGALRQRSSGRGGPPRAALPLVALAAALGLGGSTAPVAAAAPPKDKTPPVITVTITGTQGLNGWYTSDVTVAWTVKDPESRLAATTGCKAATLSAETAGVTLTCFARNAAKRSSRKTVTVKVDKTAPAVTATPSRPPDANGWYNHPLPVAFTGVDATSGIESCTSVTYAGPDTPGTSLAGLCRDRAGHSGAASFNLRYDATAPANVAALSVQAGQRVVTLRWSRITDPDVQRVEIVRSRLVGPTRPRRVYRGSGASCMDLAVKNGFRYRYVVRTYDPAGNASPEAVVVARPRARLLLRPRYGVRVTAPPVLRWQRVPGAHYYNVQLFRGGRKVFSAWPQRPRLALQVSWLFGGHPFRLRPARYRWFIWPGYGRRAQGRYAPLLGHSSFVVRR